MKWCFFCSAGSRAAPSHRFWPYGAAYRCSGCFIVFSVFGRGLPPAGRNDLRSSRGRHLIGAPRAVGGALPALRRVRAAARESGPPRSSADGGSPPAARLCRAAPSRGLGAAAPPPGPLSGVAVRVAFGASSSSLRPACGAAPPRARPPEQAASRRPGRATEGPGGGVSGARPRHHMMPLLLPAVPPRKGNWARGRGSGPLSPPQPLPLPLPRRRRPPPLPSARGRAGSAAGHGRAAGVAAAELRADRRPRLQPGRRAAGRVLGRRGQLLRLRRGLLRSRRLLVSARPRGPSAPQRVWSASSRGSAARQPSCPHSRALRHPRYVNPAELVIN